MEKKYLVVATLALILTIVVVSCATPAATPTPTSSLGAQGTPGVTESPAMETATIAAETPTTMETSTPLAGAETPTVMETPTP